MLVEACRDRESRASACKSFGRFAASIFMVPLSWYVSIPKMIRIFFDKDIKSKLLVNRQDIILNSHETGIDRDYDCCNRNPLPETPEERKRRSEATRNEAIRVENLLATRYRLTWEYTRDLGKIWLWQSPFLVFYIASLIRFHNTVDIGQLSLITLGSDFIFIGLIHAGSFNDNPENFKFRIYHLSDVFCLKKFAAKFFPFIKEYDQSFNIHALKSSSKFLRLQAFINPTIQKPPFVEELNKSFEFRLKDILSDFIPGDGFQKHGPREIIYSYMGMNVVFAGPSQRLHPSFVDLENNSRKQIRMREDLLIDLEQELNIRGGSGSFTMEMEDKLKNRIEYLKKISEEHKHETEEEKEISEEKETVNIPIALHF